MNHLLKKTLLIALGLGLSLSAQAHRAWILPASTVLSGEEPWVTFDAAISNTLFHADHAAFRIEQIQAIGPDGEAVALHNAAMGKHRSTFDVNLQQPGTYKIYTASNGLTARWEADTGERRFWPPRGQVPTAEGFAAEVPKKARNLQVSQSSRRVETFVTAGSPTDGVLTPTNNGFEMVALTHPNDLFANETAEFQFLIDGKPAVGAEVTVIPGAMRYRNSQDDITANTDKEGKVKITWPQAGTYWLNASYRDDKGKKPATTRTGSYTATFEVLPE